MYIFDRRLGKIKYFAKDSDSNFMVEFDSHGDDFNYHTYEITREGKRVYLFSFKSKEAAIDMLYQIYVNLGSQKIEF